MKLRTEPAQLHKEPVKRLFEEAFPREERPPIEFLFHRAKLHGITFRAVFDGDEMVGLIFCAKEAKSKTGTLMFLAVEGEKRGGGYGTAIINGVKKLFRGQKFFINYEPLDKDAPNYEQRVKREQFYLRNGFTAEDYTVKEAGVTYGMMSYGGHVSYEEYVAVMERIYGKALYHGIIKRM